LIEIILSPGLCGYKALMGSRRRFHLHSHRARHRLQSATAGALVCGAAVLAIGLVGLATGRMLPQRATVEPAAKVISRDFADLGPAGASSAAGLRAPTAAASSEPVDVASASPSREARRCAGATWPYFDQDCLWGNGEEAARHRKRVALRLKSPWCNGLRSKEGTHWCRPRT
jgi:hypothetical protein